MSELYEFIKRECHLYNDQINWIIYLTGNDFNEVETFLEHFRLAKGHFAGAIRRHKDYLRQQGRGNVKIESLENAVNENNINRLKELLEEMFLEPISDSIVEKTMDALHKNNKALNKLYELHKQQLNYRIQKLIKIV